MRYKCMSQFRDSLQPILHLNFECGSCEAVRVSRDGDGRNSRLWIVDDAKRCSAGSNKSIFYRRLNHILAQSLCNGSE